MRGGRISQFESLFKNSNPRGFLQIVQPYSSKCQFENGASAPEFEPFTKNGTINSEKGRVEIETCKTGTENKNIHTISSETENENKKINSNTVITKTANEDFKIYSNLTKTTNEELKTENREELNTNIESNARKNKPTTKTKTKNKATPPTIQKFSNHIKFIDYIPTHEIITYRHLFAYGFYVE